MAQVFVSYSSKDETQAMSIVKQLESSGIPCWIACRDIPVGDSFSSAIPSMIRDCPVFIVLLSDHSVRSMIVLNELTVAFRKYDHPKTIIPLMLEEFVLPDNFDFLLASTQIRHYFLNPNEILQEVISTIQAIVLSPEEIVKVELPLKMRDALKSFGSFINNAYVEMSTRDWDNFSNDVIAIDQAIMQHRSWTEHIRCPRCGFNYPVSEKDCPVCHYNNFVEELYKPNRCDYCGRIYPSGLIRCPGCGNQNTWMMLPDVNHK